jgi:competence protein ComEC
LAGDPKTGIVYIVGASGIKITFIISFLMGVLTFYLSSKKAIFFALLDVLFYLFVAGFTASLVRASIMTFVTFLGQETGRLVNSWRALLLTGGIMLIIQPD